MKLKEIMKLDLVTAMPDLCVRDAAKKMRDNNVGCVLVAEKDILLGILTDRDITCSVVAEDKNVEFTKVKDVMNKEIIFCTPETDIIEASKTMAASGIRRLPIQQNGKLKGIVTMCDLAPILKTEVDSFFSLEESYRH
jgi:CBS domain-containing protein